MLKEDKLFNDEDLEALMNLIDVVEKADEKGNVYNMSVEASDKLQEIINSSKKFTEEEKKKLKTKFNIRLRNQTKVEKLSLKAENIKMGKVIVEGKIATFRDEDEIIK